MNKINRFLLAILMLLSISIVGFAKNSISVQRFIASVTLLKDKNAPVIRHNPIQEISSIRRHIILNGKVTDESEISSFSFYYKTDNQTSFTVNTIDLSTSNVMSYNFHFEQTLDDTKAKSFIYYFKASDRLGNISTLPVNQYFTAIITSSVTVPIGANGGVVNLANAEPGYGNTHLIIPPGSISDEVNVTIEEKDPSDSSIMPGIFMASSYISENNSTGIRPIAVFKLGPEGMVFNKLLTLCLSYKDYNDNDDIIDGTKYKERDLKIMWWDGFEWRGVGGTVDTEKNLVTTQIAHFSLYAIFPAPALTDDSYRPKEKIITPALVDDKNDFATFTNLSSGDVVNIYDINGKRVRQIQISDINIWDGRDDDNELVESGLYVYQIKTAGKIISGTIAVAK